MSCVWKVIVAYFAGIVTLPLLATLVVYIIARVDERNRDIWGRDVGR